MRSRRCDRSGRWPVAKLGGRHRCAHQRRIGRSVALRGRAEPAREGEHRGLPELVAHMKVGVRNPRLDGRRVGLIIPSVNATIEPEFAWIAPARLSFHAARIMLRETTEAGLRAMNADVDVASHLLASIDPDVVAYACTSGSFLEGAQGLTRQIDAIGAIVRCPVVATSAALIAALQSLAVKRVAL